MLVDDQTLGIRFRSSTQVVCQLSGGLNAIDALKPGRCQKIPEGRNSSD
jgi:hypothetical protein